MDAAAEQHRADARVRLADAPYRVLGRQHELAHLVVDASQALGRALDDPHERPEKGAQLAPVLVLYEQVARSLQDGIKVAQVFGRDRIDGPAILVREGREPFGCEGRRGPDAGRLAGPRPASSPTTA